jgi:uncharacterized protein (TIGR03083 family)
MGPVQQNRAAAGRGDCQTHAVEAGQYLEHLRSDGDRLLAVAVEAPDADVTTCPGWDMIDLVGHTGGVHRWVTEVVRTRATQRIRRDPLGDAPDRGVDAVAQWFGAGLAELESTLATTGPETEVWNWADGRPAPAAFWIRRMAQETVIHRCDAEAAAGLPSVIDAALAADGIDEFLSFVTRDDPPAGFDGQLSLVATDVDAGWHLGLTPDRIVLREAADGGDLVRGTASDLYLWLVHRPPQNVSTVGDGAAIAAWEQVKFE